MEQVFKEFSLGLEYVIYFICTAVLLLTIVLLESNINVSFLAFIAGIIMIFLCFLTCWDLIAVGIRKHTVFGVILSIVTLLLFLGLIYDFIQAIV
ncbi:hypothetical protein KY333_03795 [Candidatus Woesearchaeota archaeon]|nr:hypothetical protein [Candidatus Woesearchaeota archaeon]